jgi:hypothetical protein
MASFLRLLPALSRQGGPKNVVELVPDALMRSGSILDQDVVAGPSVEDVLPRPADQDVVAGAAKEGVVARAANQHVVAVTTVLRELDRPGRDGRSSYDVVAGQRVDCQSIVGGFSTRDIHLSSQALSLPSCRSGLMIMLRGFFPVFLP